MIKKIGFSKHSAMEVNRYHLLPLTGMLCRLLANHFSTANNIQTDKLKQYVHDEDQSKTKILIQPHYKWVTAISHMRPAIIVKRGEIRRERFAIADGFGESLDRGIPKVVFVSGTHTVFCIDTTGGAVELLADEVFPMLLEFSPAIREDMGFTTFSVAGVGAVSKLEEFDQHFVVPITLSWVKQHSWALKYDGPWLQDVGTENKII